MCEMTDGHLSLHINVGQEGSLVVDAKSKDTMLIWQAERRTKDRAIESRCNWLEIQTVKRREHGKL